MKFLNRSNKNNNQKKFEKLLCLKIKTKFIENKNIHGNLNKTYLFWLFLGINYGKKLEYFMADEFIHN